jgi:hypothetical protein
VAFRGHGKLADSWWGATTPSTTPSGSTNTYVGVGMEFDVPGRVNGFRVWRPAASVSAGFALFFTADHELMVAKAFRDIQLPSDGWQQVWFNPWFRIDTSVWYWLAVYVKGGGWKRTNTALAADVVHNDIRFKRSFQSTSLDVVNVVLTENTNANGVDVLFQPD